MTLFHREERVCPRCHHEQEVTVWDRIDVAEDPDLKDLLLRNRLHSYDCEMCGETLTLNEAVLYLDPADGLAVYYSPLLTTAGPSPEWLAELNTQVQGLKGLPHKRLTADLKDLLEKIHLWDHNMDDRIFEILKLAFRARYKEENDANILRSYYLSGNDEIMLIQTEVEDQGWYSLQMPTELYLNAEKELGAMLGEDSSDWKLIDEAWALKMVAAGGQEEGEEGSAVD